MSPETETTTISLESLKEWFTFAAAVVTCVVAIVFWVQTSSDSKFAKVESEIQVLRQDIVWNTLGRRLQCIGYGASSGA